MTANARKPGSRAGSSTRTVARLAALQALYEVEIAEALPHEVVPAFVSSGFKGLIEDCDAGPADVGFFEVLVLGVSREMATVDPMIAAALEPDFSLLRLEVLLRAILRLGAYELVALGDIPAKVVITEYVELAHDFFSGREPALVNGVLDRLAHLVRAGELAG